MQHAITQMKRCEHNYYNHGYPEDFETFGYWFAYRTELEEYLNEYDRLDNLLKGIKPDKKNEVATSLAVYFKNASAADYMRHRQAIELFLKRAKRDKKHRIMSLWHYLKQTGAIADASETPYKFCLALHAELYNGVADGSAYQGRYYEELCKEYEAILKGE